VYGTWLMGKRRLPADGTVQIPCGWDCEDCLLCCSGAGQVQMAGNLLCCS